MGIDSIFSLVGGIGFFFLGMKTMSDGLKRVASEKLKQFLHAVTKRPIYGVSIGALTTLLVQSSSVTTVFVVGFVNASLINLAQAIPLILGANIGTTFTAWLVSFMAVFKISHYALPAVGIGFGLHALGKGRKKNVGLVLLGFGLLFTGLGYMKDAFVPLRESAIIHNSFLMFGDQPLLGVAVGIIFTVLLQSSSATIAIVQVMAFNGLLSFETAIPIMLGDNIGTTITAQMAAVGTNLNARRTAMCHTIFNVIGVLIMLIFVYAGWYSQFIKIVVPGNLSTLNIMLHIAVAHSIFNVLNTAFFLPFIKILEKASIYLVPKKEDTIDYGTQYLEDHLLDSPSIALEQVRNEILYMMKIAQKAVTSGVDSFTETSLTKANKACELEAVTDSLQSQITKYIVLLSQKKLDEKESTSIPILIHHVNDLERIGDHSQNLAELTKKCIEEKLVFSEESVAEIRNMVGKIYKMFKEAEKAFKNLDRTSAKKLLDYEDQVDQLEETLKQNHVVRLKAGKCQMDSGFIFLEIVYNLEKIGDRLSNVAQAVLLEPAAEDQKEQKTVGQGAQ